VTGIDSSAASRIAESLFIERSWRSRSSTRFWVLLILASIIAAAGVAADSTATVIGAMIVAPLMTPILGCALALVLADRPHLWRSVRLVLGGAVAVIVIGYLIGLIVATPDGFASNSQVASRISPKLIDLLAALATGTVGAFALVRTDISDALPGVAIAISLVPPLSVTGMLISAGRYHDAAQSALLFGTNVAAIIATATIVFLLYRVRDATAANGGHVGRLRGSTLAAVLGLVLLVAIPLGAGSLAVARDERLTALATPIATGWADAAGWQITGVQTRNSVITVTTAGAGPGPDPLTLRQALNAAGATSPELVVRLIAGGTRVCFAGRNECAADPGR
jgi:uncharacterized hydrophobic protein (TIGR00271 family)